MALLVIPVAMLAACSDGDGDTAEFNEPAARAAAIEWNPGNTESVDYLVNDARAFCADEQLISDWIEESQSFVSSEGRDVYLAACPVTIAETAQRLALPVPD